jgi:hypothetical protein
MVYRMSYLSPESTGCYVNTMVLVRTAWRLNESYCWHQDLSGDSGQSSCEAREAGIGPEFLTSSYSLPKGFNPRHRCTFFLNNSSISSKDVVSPSAIRKLRYHGLRELLDTIMSVLRDLIGASLRRLVTQDDDVNGHSHTNHCNSKKCRI